MATLFILLPKLVCLPHNTMEFFDFTRDLKMNAYDQLQPYLGLHKKILVEVVEDILVIKFQP